MVINPSQLYSRLFLIALFLEISVVNAIVESIKIPSNNECNLRLYINIRAMRLPDKQCDWRCYE